ncbi:unnamed protein product [Caenorhabditis auriculariae]|uniref:BHLH domain-containing protein n=1 Tax=Caenorhabditis auriculariae TaxID=2777116 RepID=A0A8S1GPP0_9PELO|nr:unnamed protein product [Caenorhabditis auriculariae]
MTRSASESRIVANRRERRRVAEISRMFSLLQELIYPNYPYRIRFTRVAILKLATEHIQKLMFMLDPSYKPEENEMLDC